MSAGSTGGTFRSGSHDMTGPEAMSGTLGGTLGGTAVTAAPVATTVPAVGTTGMPLGGTRDVAADIVGRGGAMGDITGTVTEAGIPQPEGVRIAAMRSPAGTVGMQGVGTGMGTGAEAVPVSSDVTGRAADLNVGRGVAGTTAAAGVAGALGMGMTAGSREGVLKRGGSSSSSGTSGDMGDVVRDTVTQRDVGFESDVRKAVDSPMPTPATLVSSSEIPLISSSETLSGPATGAGSGPTVAYGSAEAERTLLPMTSGREADVMVGTGTSTVAQRQQQLLQQQQVGESTVTEGVVRSSPISSSRGVTGRTGGGLIASIKGMLGVAKSPSEEASW